MMACDVSPVVMFLTIINLNFSELKDYSSYGLNVLGPLCLRQCLKGKARHED